MMCRVWLRARRWSSITVVDGRSSVTASGAVIGQIRRGRCRSIPDPKPRRPGHRPAGGSAPARSRALHRPELLRHQLPRGRQLVVRASTVSSAASISSRSMPFAAAPGAARLRDRWRRRLPGLDPVAGERRVVDQTQLLEPIQHRLGGLGSGTRLALSAWSSSCRVRALARQLPEHDLPGRPPPDRPRDRPSGARGSACARRPSELDLARSPGRSRPERRAADQSPSAP